MTTPEITHARQALDHAHAMAMTAVRLLHAAGEAEAVEHAIVAAAYLAEVREVLDREEAPEPVEVMA
ncbi:MAG: hypothetical protein KY475_14920 [Planctomycetes bacterium]|nr:hypothetical protein [Planctomycetota bacterium]